MIAEITSSWFEVKIEGDSIGIYFDLSLGTIEVFNNSTSIHRAKLQPTFLSFSPSNIIEIARFHHSAHIRKSLELEQQNTQMLLDSNKRSMKARVTIAD